MSKSASLAAPLARASAIPLWAVAAIAAVAMHGALGAGLIWTMANEEPDDEMGAPAIEIAMDMAAPKTEQSEAPPGPESVASAAAPESAEAKPKTEATDRPKEEATETENPDRVVSVQEPEKPQEKVEEPQPTPSQASTASVAAEDSAAPKQEATPPAAVARAPVIGTGRAALQQRATWQKRLVAHLNRHKRYPADGQRREARVEISFSIDRSGHVQGATVAKSSGFPGFDAAALAMVRRADPVPAPPPLVADEGLTFSMPVVFRVEHR